LLAPLVAAASSVFWHVCMLLILHMPSVDSDVTLSGLLCGLSSGLLSGLLCWSLGLLHVRQKHSTLAFFSKSTRHHATNTCLGAQNKQRTNLLSLEPPSYHWNVSVGLLVSECGHHEIVNLFQRMAILDLILQRPVICFAFPTLLTVRTRLKCDRT
jgi:hypothetical protein